MKKLKLLFVAVFATMTSITVVAQNSDVQLIAVHVGNVDNMSVLDKSAFPDFEFYYNNAPLTAYSEEQKLVGNPKYLMGWYGEVPEKMGFGVNYRGTYGKGHSFPYYDGSLYVVDPEGTINYQLQAERFNEENYPDTYYKIMDDITNTVRRIKKGKYVSKIKANKQEYLKRSPVGELEELKGSKIDDKNEGLVGWDLPDITVKNESGESISLKELTNGKVSVIVFFTLNGAHYLNADKKGEIVKEWDGMKLIAPSSYASGIQEKAMSGNYESKAEAKKGFAKTMFKAAVASGDNSLAQLIVNNKEELDEAQRTKAYGAATQNIIMIEKIADQLKK